MIVRPLLFGGDSGVSLTVHGQSLRVQAICEHPAEAKAPIYEGLVAPRQDQNVSDDTAEPQESNSLAKFNAWIALTQASVRQQCFIEEKCLFLLAFHPQTVQARIICITHM